MRGDVLKRSKPENYYKLVCFFVGEVRYAVDIMEVKEIVNPENCAPIPLGPGYVVGVAEHRDEVVPVIDMHLRFGLETRETTRQTKWLLVEAQGEAAALVVDRVTEVVKTAQKKGRQTLFADDENPWVKEVYSDKNGLIFQLDLQAIIGKGALKTSLESLGVIKSEG